MKTSKLLLNAVLFVVAVSVSSCYLEEDPGPLQSQTKEFAILDFDRLEVGDAFNVTVVQGNLFTIRAEGDRRNIEDLDIQRIGTTLRVRFVNTGVRWRDRNFTTYLTITMPSLKGAMFSSAVTSSITGFDESNFDLTMSGASVSQVNLDAGSVNLNISGASELNISGNTDNVMAIVSGASKLGGFSLNAASATVDASGASRVNIFASSTLKATASGASHIYYRGQPALNSTTSGASVVQHD